MMEPVDVSRILHEDMEEKPPRFPTWLLALLNVTQKTNTQKGRRRWT